MEPIGLDFQYADKAEITHTEAVNTMAALKAIEDQTDGSYDPTGNVTCAEMDKLVCVMLNGGDEPAWAPGSFRPSGLGNCGG